MLTEKTQAAAPFHSFDIRAFLLYTVRAMENPTTNIDLSTLDTEAMRSRLSELGSYL